MTFVRVCLEARTLTKRVPFVVVFIVMTTALGLFTYHVTQALLVDVAGLGGHHPLWQKLATLFVAGP